MGVPLTNDAQMRNHKLSSQSNFLGKSLTCRAVRSVYASVRGGSRNVAGFFSDISSRPIQVFWSAARMSPELTLAATNCTAQHVPSRTAESGTRRSSRNCEGWLIDSSTGTQGLLIQAATVGNSQEPRITPHTHTHTLQSVRQITHHKADFCYTAVGR